MRRVTALLSTAALVLFMAGLSAQGKTDFTGKWTPDAEKNAANAPAGGGGRTGGGGNRGGGFGGGAMTITQDAKTLKIEREAGQNGQAPAPQVYNLDGTPSKNTMGQSEATSTAKWDGAKLVISTTRSMNGNDVTTTSTYSLEGGELSVATTSPGRNGGEPTTRTTFYKKG